MNKMRKRLSKPLLFIGVLLLLFSFAPSRIGGNDFTNKDGEFSGMIVMNSGDILVNAQSLTESTFSLYLFDNESGMKLFREYSMENVSPIVSIENTSNYQGVIDLPSDKAYFLVVTQSNISPSESWVNINVYRATPHPRVISMGFVLMSVALILSYPEIREIVKRFM